MIVIVSENPEPESPIRKDVNIEVRIMIKGATEAEGEKLGEAFGSAMEDIRPGQKFKAFSVDKEFVNG